MMAGMPEFLVQYGSSGFVGRYTHDAELPDSQTAVIVQSPRGVELGTVLERIAEPLASSRTQPCEGQLLRSATADDLVRHERLRMQAVARLAAIDVEQHPIAVLDAEYLHDGRGLILHVLPYGECQLDAWLGKLSDSFNMPVRVLNVGQLSVTVDPAEPTSKCGSGGCGTSGGGCGTSGGGCSTGSCSRGSVKTAAELTDYFAGLRNQLERSQRIPLHG